MSEEAIPKQSLLEVVNAQGAQIKRLEHILQQTQFQLQEAQEALSLRSRHHAQDRQTLHDLEELVSAACSLAELADVPALKHTEGHAGERVIRNAVLAAAVAIRNRARAADSEGER